MSRVRQEDERRFRAAVAALRESDRSNPKVANLVATTHDWLATQPTLVEFNFPRPTIATRAKTWIKATFLKTFLETYPPEGYEVNHGFTATADNVQRYDANDLTLGVMLATFFALPTRLDTNGQYTVRQFLRNLIGGWNPVPTNELGEKMWTEKHRWQYLAIPVKFLIIAPLKLLSIPVKFLINLVKLITEFVPMMLRELFTVGYNAAIQQNAFLLRMRAGPGFLDGFIQGLAVVGYFLFVTLPVGFLYTMITAAHLIGRTITSPLKSMTMSFYFGRKLEKYNFPGAYIISHMAGGALAGISIAISAMYWALLFPLMIGAAIAYVPALVQAATWVSQLPVISNILNVVNVILAWVSTAPVLVNSIGPAVVVYGNLLGLQLSASLVIMGTALGYAAALVGTLSSHVADAVSNAWALLGWKNYKSGGPLTSIANFVSSILPKRNQYVQLAENIHVNVTVTGRPNTNPFETELRPTGNAASVVNESSRSLSGATMAAGQLDSTGLHVEKGPEGPPSYQAPASGEPSAPGSAPPTVEYRSK